MRLRLPLRDRPGRRQRVAGAHRRLEARRMLEIGDRRPMEMHSDRRAHHRARDHPMQDPRPETRSLRVFVVDVMRIEIADEPGAEHEVRLGDRDRAAERVADRDFVIRRPARVHAESRLHRALLAFPSATQCVELGQAQARERDAGVERRDQVHDRNERQRRQHETQPEQASARPADDAVRVRRRSRARPAHRSGRGAD